MIIQIKKDAELGIVHLIFGADTNSLSARISFTNPEFERFMAHAEIARVATRPYSAEVEII